MRTVAIALALGLAAGALVVAYGTSAWTQMLAIMGSVLWAGKAMLLTRHYRALRTARPGRFLPFVIAWPGMNTRRFLLARTVPPRPTRTQWLDAVTCAGVGAGCLVLGTFLRQDHGDVATWIGLVGLAYLVFFGLFEMLSLMYRSAGIDAQPLFRQPRKSRNLTEMWSRRWNRGVHDLILETVYAPLARHSAVLALVVTFLASGGLHELVLSVPARGGYGMPTLYFAIQAASVALIGSRTGRRWGLHDGKRAWWFGVVVAIGALGLLFVPAFHRNVMRPLLDDVGAVL